MGFPSWSVVALDVENATPRLLFGEMAGLAVHAMPPFGRDAAAFRASTSL
jgi:hypothetical protein